MAGRQGVGEWNILGTLTFEGWLKLDIIVLTNATVTVCHHHGKGNDDDYHHHHHHGHNHNRNQKQHGYVCVWLCSWWSWQGYAADIPPSVLPDEQLAAWLEKLRLNGCLDGQMTDVLMILTQTWYLYKYFQIKSNQIKCRAFLYMYQRNSNEAK